MGQEYGKSNILNIAYCEFSSCLKIIEKIVGFFSLKITQAKLFFI
jgi:hypothetical protein